MRHETELDVIEPSSQAALTPQYPDSDVGGGSKLERNVSAVSNDGRKRGKWQVTAILIALFVRLPDMLSISCNVPTPAPSIMKNQHVTNLLDWFN